MTLFRNVVFLAAVVGLLSGLVMAGLQAVATTPLIIEAETFEQGTADDHGSAGGHSHDTATTTATTQSHGHEEHSHGGWAPADGFERFAFTAMANVVTAIGFALILITASEFAGGLSGWREGLIWGFAGFAVFTLAPALGLPPELPGMPAADLMARQTWWVATAIATAAGLALVVFSRIAPLVVLGIVLLVAPHVIGAPQPESHASPVPAGLHHDFIVMVTVTSLLFWCVLGAAAGGLRSRFFGQAKSDRLSLA